MAATAKELLKCHKLNGKKNSVIIMQEIKCANIPLHLLHAHPFKSRLSNFYVTSLTLLTISN